MCCPCVVVFRVQCGRIRLRRDRNLHQLLVVLVRPGFGVYRIRVQNRSAHQPFFYALPQYLTEDLFRDVVLPEAPAPVLADRHRIRRLLFQIKSAKPLACDTVVDSFFKPRLRFDPVQIPHKQHPKQYFRVNGRPAITRTIQRRSQMVDETEIRRPIHFLQKAIFRHHLLHDHCLQIETG